MEYRDTRLQSLPTHIKLKIDRYVQELTREEHERKFKHVLNVIRAAGPSDIECAREFVVSSYIFTTGFWWLPRVSEVLSSALARGG